MPGTVTGREGAASSVIPKREQCVRPAAPLRPEPKLAQIQGDKVKVTWKWSPTEPRSKRANPTGDSYRANVNSYASSLRQALAVQLSAPRVSPLPTHTSAAGDALLEEG